MAEVGLHVKKKAFNSRSIASKNNSMTTAGKELASKFHQWLTEEMRMYPNSKIPTIEDLLDIFTDRRFKEKDLWHWIVTHVKSLHTMSKYSCMPILSSEMPLVKDADSQSQTVIYIGDNKHNELYRQKLIEIEKLKSRRIEQQGLVAGCIKHLRDTRLKIEHADNNIRKREEQVIKAKEDIFLLQLCEKKMMLSSVDGSDKLISELNNMYENIVESKASIPPDALPDFDADTLYESLVCEDSQEEVYSECNNFNDTTLKHLSLFDGSKALQSSKTEEFSGDNLEPTFLEMVSRLVQGDLVEAQDNINKMREINFNTESTVVESSIQVPSTLVQEENTLKQLESQIALLVTSNDRLEAFADSLEDTSEMQDRLNLKLRNQEALITALTLKSNKQEQDIANAEKQLSDLQFESEAAWMPKVDKWQTEMESLSSMFKRKVENKLSQMSKSLQEDHGDDVEYTKSLPIKHVIATPDNYACEVNDKITLLQNKSSELTQVIKTKYMDLDKRKLPECLDKVESKRKQRLQALDNVVKLNEFTEQCLSNVRYTEQCKNMQS